MKLGELLRNTKGKEPPIEVQPQQGVVSVAVRDIDVNPYQPRKTFTEETIRELADSIAEHGMLQPIIVRPRGERYEVVVGERRLRACKLLGWSEVPAIVREADDRIVAEMALIENLQREDLHFLEEADGLERLIREFGLTQEELGRRMGLSQSTIANKLRLLRLSEKVREFISREMISERHARALLKLGSEEEQLRVLEAVLKRDLNVRDTEKLIADLGREKKVEKGKKQTIVRIYKDVRLFRNSLFELVKNMEAAGIPVSVQENDSGEEWTVTVCIRPVPKVEREVARR